MENPLIVDRRNSAILTRDHIEVRLDGDAAFSDYRGKEMEAILAGADNSGEFYEMCVLGTRECIPSGKVMEIKYLGKCALGLGRRTCKQKLTFEQYLTHRRPKALYWEKSEQLMVLPEITRSEEMADAALSCLAEVRGKAPDHFNQQ